MLLPFIRPNVALPDITSRLDDAEVKNDAQLLPCDGASRFASKSEVSKRTVDLNHSSMHLDGLNHKQTREEQFKQQMDNGKVKSLKTISDLEVSKTLLKLYEDRGNTNAYSEREAFFSALDTTQSQKCGDFLIEKLADIVANYSAVQRQRRDIEISLEAEIAGRERHVDTRKGAVDRKLDELRQAGKGLVRGKPSTSELD